MLYQYNKHLVSTAQELRKNMTKEEKHLWYDFLNKLPVNVNRQKIIGNYIVDFFIAKKRLVIEIDGIQHDFNDNHQKDLKRDEYLSKLGIKVLRYTNIDINKRFYSVCKDILKYLDIKEEDIKF